MLLYVGIGMKKNIFRRINISNTKQVAFMMWVIFFTKRRVGEELPPRRALYETVY